MAADDVIEGGTCGEGGVEGGDKLKGKRHEETQDNKKGDRGKVEEVDVDKTKRHVSVSGDTVKKNRVCRKCPHNRDRNRCRD